MTFIRRDNEPEYALLRDNDAQPVNRYGRSIDLDDPAPAEPLRINGEPAPAENPNRYKQHGFFFTADNCIACHACEAACSEKNDNPPHIAFRSVGFVEGGSYPAYQRINISMACNHCDNPVCLKGCPTRAYTKYAEYGAVLQDPDICFGCGYCTWVCPYNAPQLDPVEGQVSKCNMCVDRLEVGLKPACVAACLGNALDFGVIENIPENRVQAKTEIPGFPRPDITHPNIRFQQTRTLQRDMHRVDLTALKYHRDDRQDRYRPTVDPKHGLRREWNWKKLLGSHENAHIAFTLSAQTVMGAFLLMLTGHFANSPMRGFIGSGAELPALGLMLVLMIFGLFKLNMHLGKPHRFYRGFYNLRLSPVSREIAGVSAFFAGLAGYGLFALFDNAFAGLLQALSGLLALAGLGFGGYYMYKLYRIPARPFWDHPHTGMSFIATGLTLGALLLALIALGFGVMDRTLATFLSGAASAGLLLEALGLLYHRYSLKSAENEGAVSFHEQTTRFGGPYRLRNGLLATALVTGLALALSGSNNPGGFLLLALLALAVFVIGRALFYVVVIPTTMPGAFFWKNRGFIEHARETGLADMPQLGVAHERHHPFRLDELIDTIRNTPMQQKLDQLKRIFSG
jgi:DMSO reductase iron-sulfur subunit